MSSPPPAQARSRGQRPPVEVRAAGHPPRARPRKPAAGHVARIPTAFPALDGALQGGWPRGRLSELCGPVTSGKLTLAAKAIAALQQADAAGPRRLAGYHTHLRPRLSAALRRRSAPAAGGARRYADRRAGAAAAPGGKQHARFPGRGCAAHWIRRRRHPVCRPGTPGPARGAHGHRGPLSERNAGNLPGAGPRRGRAGVPAPRAVAHARRRMCAATKGQAEVIKNRFGPTGVRVPVRIVFNGTVRGEGL